MWWLQAAGAAQACLFEVGMGAEGLSLGAVGMGEMVGMGEAGGLQGSMLSLGAVGMGEMVGMGEAGGLQGSMLSLGAVGMGEGGEWQAAITRPSVEDTWAGVEAAGMAWPATMRAMVTAATEWGQSWPSGPGLRLWDEAAELQEG